MEQIKELPVKLLAFVTKFTGMMLLGVLWLVMPSILIYMVGVAYDVPNPYTSATNAFVFWVVIQVFVFSVYRIIIADMKRVVKECHDDYVRKSAKKRVGDQ